MPENTALEVPPTAIELAIYPLTGIITTVGTTLYNPANSTNHYSINYSSTYINDLRRLYVDLSKTDNDFVNLSCVTVADINAIIRNVLGTGFSTAAQRIACDVDINSEINIGDAIQVRRVILGLDNKFNNSITVNGTTHDDVIAVYPTSDDLFLLTTPIIFSSMYQHQFNPGTVFGRDFAAINLGDPINTGCGVFKPSQEITLNPEPYIKEDEKYHLTLRVTRSDLNKTTYSLYSEDYIPQSIISFRLKMEKGVKIESVNVNDAIIDFDGFRVDKQGSALRVLTLPKSTANIQVIDTPQRLLSFTVENNSSIRGNLNLVSLDEDFIENVHYSYQSGESRLKDIKLITGKQTGSETSIRVNPNPFTNSINISSEKGQIKEISVFDLNGRLLFNSNNINSNVQKIESSSLESLSPGSYYLEVSKVDGSKETVKVIKSN
jgi:hypothetical protein